MIDLDALEEFAKEGSHYPWDCSPEDSGGAFWQIEDSDGCNIAGGVDAGDAQLIVTMFNALPHLIAELRAARAVVEMARHPQMQLALRDRLAAYDQEVNRG